MPKDMYTIKGMCNAYASNTGVWQGAFLYIESTGPLWGSFSVSSPSVNATSSLTRMPYAPRR